MYSILIYSILVERIYNRFAVWFVGFVQQHWGGQELVLGDETWDTVNIQVHPKGVWWSGRGFVQGI